MVLTSATSIDCKPGNQEFLNVRKVCRDHIAAADAEPPRALPTCKRGREARDRRSRRGSDGNAAAVLHNIAVSQPGSVSCATTFGREIACVKASYAGRDVPSVRLADALDGVHERLHSSSLML